MLVFEEGGKTGGPGEKTLGARTGTNSKLNPHTYDAEFGNRTRPTLVGGEGSHHCAIPAGKKVTKLAYKPQVAQTPDFCSMKQLRKLLVPLDGIGFIHLAGERQCGAKFPV